MTTPSTIGSMALALVLLGTSVANAANPNFMGKWTVTASQPAPWARPDDKPVESDLKALVGKAVTFSADRIDAPRPLTCRKPHYEMKQYDPDMLFQGGLTDPTKQAAALGYGKKIATLETGCEGAFDFHFINSDSAMFALNNRLYKIERKKP
ncbi:hypothetical protein [Bradyrhizobium sp. SYSU BS000235]|uniref:hypothetical protein n=1 Tax=Bradyrhizobium sp. SYSU BS000235 TaxID=3411332 RepID=UPI003C713A74